MITLLYLFVFCPLCQFVEGEGSHSPANRLSQAICLPVMERHAYQLVQFAHSITHAK